jgi:TIR domain
VRSNYSVFFSHKVGDEGVTKSLIDLLARHTELVDFIISENIEKGKDWRQEIADALSRANFLVLVFTDPNENWGWCLYESGFFDALSQVSKSSGKLIWCLHHASIPPPSPLAGLQAITATKHDDVEKWLKQLFRNTGQTKDQFLDAIPELAEKICSLFSVDQKPIYSERSIKITANRTLLSPDDLPDNAAVEGDDRLMAELFGTYDQQIDWKSVKGRFLDFDNTVDVNLTTLKEISNAIYCISKRTVFRPIQGIIFVEDGPKRYRPILSRVKEKTVDYIDCDVMFVEESGGQLQNIRKPVDALLTAIRMAVRIRWEIIRPFASDIRTQARLDPRKLRSDLQTCFNNIFLEAGFRGNFSKKDLADAFDAPDKKRLLNIMDEWEEACPTFWRGIGFTDMKETFGKVSAERMTEEDISLLESALQEIETLNRDFLAMAVARGELLIQNELRTNIGVVHQQMSVGEGSAD